MLCQYLRFIRANFLRKMTKYTKMMENEKHYIVHIDPQVYAFTIILKQSLFFFQRCQSIEQ